MGDGMNLPWRTKEETIKEALTSMSEMLGQHQLAWILRQCPLHQKVGI